MVERVPLRGTTLVTGPSNAGKTHATAQALARFVDRHGPDGVVVLDFAPELERDGEILGGRLDRAIDVPGGVWYEAIDAHAPRASGETAAEAATLAARNARRAEKLLSRAPADPRAVFVNDATIPLQSGDIAVERLRAYVSGAEVAVLNAFESDELGVDDDISRREREALADLREWADRVLALEGRD